MKEEYKDYLVEIEKNKKELEEISDSVWSYAELSYYESKSAELISNYLAEKGFEVKEGTYNIPTSFTASYGQGRPYIGILGEYDALANLSQESGILNKSAMEEGAPGHGCGHNLLGVGSLAAVLAIKAYLENTGKSGTVIYYGCPAEEKGSGKAFMAREGAFDELDLAYCWHPAELNEVMQESSLANVSVRYSFYGVSAHAAENPQDGRSALDGLELMNVGVNFLREHINPLAKVHYAITNAGGLSANVVQPNAEAVYLIRDTDINKAYELWDRVNKVAEGAAMATETRVEYQMQKSCANFVSNKVMEKSLAESFKLVEFPHYTKEEYEYAEKLSETALNVDTRAKRRISDMLYTDNAEYMRSRADAPIFEGIVPYEEKANAGYLSGSTDVGDVSWCCPTAQIRTATWCARSGGHSWQIVAQGKSSYAKKGMLYAGKVIACSAMDFIDNPELVERAKEEYSLFRKYNDYRPIPVEVLPGANK